MSVIRKSFLIVRTTITKIKGKPYHSRHAKPTSSSLNDLPWQMDGLTGLELSTNIFGGYKLFKAHEIDISSHMLH